jgi:hypothetical protein
LYRWRRWHWRSISRGEGQIVPVEEVALAFNQHRGEGQIIPVGKVALDFN